MTHVCQYFISKTHVWFLSLDFYTIRLTPTSIELHSFLHMDLHFSGVDVVVVGRSPTTTDIGNRLLFPWMMRKRWQFSPTNCAFFQLYKLFQWDSTFSPARLWKFSPRRGPTVCQTIDFERRSGPGSPDPTTMMCSILCRVSDASTSTLGWWGEKTTRWSLAHAHKNINMNIFRRMTPLGSNK